MTRIASLTTATTEENQANKPESRNEHQTASNAVSIGPEFRTRSNMFMNIGTNRLDVVFMERLNVRLQRLEMRLDLLVDLIEMGFELRVKLLKMRLSLLRDLVIGATQNWMKMFLVGFASSLCVGMQMEEVVMADTFPDLFVEGASTIGRAMLFSDRFFFCLDFCLESGEFVLDLVQLLLQ